MHMQLTAHFKNSIFNLFNTTLFARISAVWVLNHISKKIATAASAGQKHY